MSVSALLLSLIVGCLTGSSPIRMESLNQKPPVSANNSSIIQAPPVEGQRIDNKGSTTLNCDDPKGYSLKEEAEPGTHAVNIVRGGTVLHTIKLLTDIERNGFGFNGMKKTREGFEIAIEYGSRMFYAKRFIFICRQHKFFLSKIRVDSFDRHNPERWSRKVIRVQPYVPLEKFSITDFMLEGVATPTKTLVEVQCGGDDNLTQGVCRNVYNEFASTPDFVITDEDNTGALIVRIPTNVNWKRARKKTRVFYTVEFTSAGDKKLGTGKGSCWNDDFGTCAQQIVRRARIESRKVHQQDDDS